MNASNIFDKAVLLLLLTSLVCSSTPRAQAQQRYDHGDPTVYEQMLLELLNRARANPGAEASRFGLSNLNGGLPGGKIVNAPKPPLAFQPNLMRAASDHTQWMISANKFQHEGPDAARADGGARMATAGYVFSGNSRWGENISWASPGGGVDVKALTIDSHRRLFLSAGHRENICNPALEEAGIDVRTGVYGGRTGVMITEDFATSAWSPGPLLTGVVYIDANNNAFYDPGEGVSGVHVMPDRGDWFAVTSNSGGYAVPYPSGNGAIKVTFSGSILRRAMTSAVSRTGMNVKLDLNPGQQIETAAHFVEGSLAMSAAAGFSAQVAGLPGAVFSIEHSEDLNHWTTVGRYTLDQHTMSILHRPVSKDCGFYRLRR